MSNMSTRLNTDNLVGQYIDLGKEGQYRLEDRMDYQDIFGAFLEENGFDGYGFFYPWESPCKNLTKNSRDGFSNAVFEINPYYWGSDDEEIAKPNFVFSPGKLEISWYKYPMRGAVANRNISPKDLKRILTICQASMVESDSNQLF